jgi:hypothetical protein
MLAPPRSHDQTNRRPAKPTHYIPRGAIHWFHNHGGRDMKGLCVITPAAIRPHYFRDATEAIDAAASGWADREKMAGVMIRSRPHAS